MALQTTNETSNSLQCFKDSTKETRPVIKLQRNVLQSVTITHRATTSNKLALHKCKLNTTKPDSSSTHHCKYCDNIYQHRQSRMCKSNEVPHNKQIEPQRSFYSTRKRPYRPTTRIAKPTTQQQTDIQNKLLTGQNVLINSQMEESLG